MLKNIPYMRWKEKLLSRNGKIGLGSTLALLLIVLLMVKACAPAKGSILYGVCGAFLEQQVQYPEMLEHLHVEQYRSGLRIYYTQVDAFGQYLSEFIECSFVSHPQKGLQLRGIVFNTIKKITKKTTVKNKGRLYEVQKKHIDEFNNSGAIQAIIAAEPDLTLPSGNPFLL